MKELIEKIEKFVVENERNILLYVARKINLPYDREVDTDAKLSQQILDFERSGKTGMDCGWTFVLDCPNNTQESVQEVYDYMIEHNVKSNVLSTGTFWIMDSATPCINLRLPNYSLNVQSTTIKLHVEEYIIEHMNLNWQVYTKLD